MKRALDYAGRLTALLPELRLPELGRGVEIPVYLIHNAPDPEEDFLLIEFEEFVERSTGGLIANLLLLVATSTGKALFGNVTPPRWLNGKSAGAKLADQIEGTRKAAGAATEVALHRELCDHAFGDGGAGPISGIEREAWPLPGHPRAHLQDRRSGSWW